MYYFYVLQSRKRTEWFYKGLTSDLKRRLKEHVSGRVDSTRPYLPIRLVYYEAYISKKSAIA